LLYQEARDALAWLRCRERSEAAVESELQILKLELEQDKSSKFSGALKTLRKFHSLSVSELDYPAVRVLGVQ
jgi:hypothetical protein